MKSMNVPILLVTLLAIPTIALGMQTQGIQYIGKTRVRSPINFGRQTIANSNNNNLHQNGQIDSSDSKKRKGTDGSQGEQPAHKKQRHPSKEQLEDELKKSKQTEQELFTTLAGKCQEIARLKAGSTDAEDKQRIAQLEHEKSDLQDELITIEGDFFTLKNSTKKLKAKAKQLREELQEAEEGNEKRILQMKRLTEVIADLRKKKSELLHEVDDYSDKLLESENRVVALEQEKQQAIIQLTIQHQQRLDAANTAFSALLVAKNKEIEDLKAQVAALEADKTDRVKD